MHPHNEPRVLTKIFVGGSIFWYHYSVAADYQYFGWRFEEGKETCHVWKEAINEELIIWKRLSHSKLKLVRTRGWKRTHGLLWGCAVGGS